MPQLSHALCSCDGCREETEARSAGVMDTEHIEAFQRFVQSEFLDKKKVGSKVITKAKGALITAFLSGWRYSRKRCALQVLGEISLGESTVLSSQEEGIIISTASYIIGIFKHLQCISPAMK